MRDLLSHGDMQDNLPPSAYDFTQQGGGGNPAETITMASKMNTGSTPDLGDGNAPPVNDEEVPF